MKTVHELKLHESINLPDSAYQVLRVPGGWIYRNKHDDQSVFVPFDNEFTY